MLNPVPYPNVPIPDRRGEPERPYLIVKSFKDLPSGDSHSLRDNCLALVEDERNHYRWTQRWVKVIPEENNRIVCAAEKFDDGTVMVSVRHRDNVFHQANKDRRNKMPATSGVQGFVDKFGNFHTRQEAWIIAEAAGQIFRRLPSNFVDGIGVLYSENLY